MLLPSSETFLENVNRGRLPRNWLKWTYPVEVIVLGVTRIEKGVECQGEASHDDQQKDGEPRQVRQHRPDYLPEKASIKARAWCSLDKARGVTT